MAHHLHAEDHGEWLNFLLPMGSGDVPVKLTREAMQEHFGAEAGQSLVDVYRQHGEAIHQRVSVLVTGLQQFTREDPLVVRSKDL